MSVNHSAAWLLLGVAGMAGAQTADLRVLSSASPSTDLVVGQEIVITTTATNDGPSPTDDVFVFWSAPLFQPFVLEDAQSVTPGCTLDIFDIDPPRFNFSFLVDSLAPGEQRTCAVSMRVRVIPASRYLDVGADISTAATTDPSPSNNSVLYRLTFASPAPLSIPTLTTFGLIVLVAGALSLVFIQRAGGRR